MAAHDTDRVSVLIVRVWFESRREARGFRARIISARDVESDDRETVAVTSPDDLLDAIRRWLAQLDE